jgi:hypothetical protein
VPSQQWAPKALVQKGKRQPIAGRVAEIGVIVEYDAGPRVTLLVAADLWEVELNVVDENHIWPFSL